MALWTPALLATALWVDGSIDNPLVDLSSDARPLSMPSGTAGQFAQTAPADGINGKRAFAVFTQNEGGLQVGGPSMVGQQMTVFFVTRGTTQTGSQALWGDASTSSGTGAIVPIAQQSGTTNSGVWRGVSVGNSPTRPQPYINGTAQTWGTRAAAYVGITGAAPQVLTLANVGIEQPVGRIGGAPFSYNYRGWMGEILFVKGYLSDEDRQKVEGYLAHKWGTVDSLPAVHPYKTAAPTTGTAPPVEQALPKYVGDLPVSAKWLSDLATGTVYVGGDVADQPAGGVPVNTVNPVVSGYPYSGRGLQVSTGTWSNNATSYTYQWRRDGQPISGATTNIYALTAADRTKVIDCLVGASNVTGDGVVVASNATIPIMAALPAGQTIVAEGDSVMLGLNANAAGTGPDSNYAWVKQVGDAFGMPVTNIAQGSRTLAPHTQSPNTNNSYQSIVVDGNATGAKKKDYIFIACGGNDALAGPSYSSTTQVVDYYRRIIAKLLDGGYTRDTIFIGGMYYVTNAALSSQGRNRAYWETFVAAIEGVAREFGLPYLDFYKKVAVAADISSDGLHPSRQGHTELAKAVIANQPYVPQIPKMLNLNGQVGGFSAQGRAGYVIGEWVVYQGALDYTVRVLDATTFAVVSTITVSALAAVVPIANAGNYKVQVRANLQGGQNTPWVQQQATVAVTAPSPFFYDTFSGETVDKALSIHVPELGAAWRPRFNDMRVSTQGRAYPTAVSIMAAGSQSPGADCVVEVEIDCLTAMADQDIHAIVARATLADALTFYGVRWRNGVWEVETWELNGISVVASVSDAFTSGSRKVSLVLYGNRGSLLIDGVQRAAFVSNANLPGREVGFTMPGTSTALTPTTGRQWTSFRAYPL